MGEAATEREEPTAELCELAQDEEWADGGKEDGDHKRCQDEQANKRAARYWQHRLPLQHKATQEVDEVQRRCKEKEVLEVEEPGEQECRREIAASMQAAARHEEHANEDSVVLKVHVVNKKQPRVEDCQCRRHEAAPPVSAHGCQ